MGVLMHRQGMPIGYIAITLALVASMGGFIFGYDTGQISDILLMDDFRIRFSGCPADSTVDTCDFTRVRSGAIVALLSIGTLIGALLGAPTADYFGRRRAMIIQCVIFMIGVIIQITAFNSWAQFAIGRLVSGLGVGGLSAAVPTYQAETAPSQIRGSLTATYQLFITLGILVAYAISIGTRSMSGSGSWRTVVGIGLIWPMILIGGMLFMPESPRWLAKQGRIEHARESLARVRGIGKHEAHEHRIVKAEAEGIQSQVEYERNIQAGWLTCFKPKDKILYRTLLGMTLQMLQQLTGANYFFYYGATVFKSVGISDSYVTQLILGAVNFVSTFGGIYIMERFGRRWPLIIGGLWQSAWLFVFAGVGTAKNPEEDKTVGMVMIISACLFIFGYAMTWAPGVWIIIGETFPTRTRAKQASLATASNWLWNFLLAFFTPFIVGDINYAYGFIFAGCNLAGAIIVFFFLYESSDLSLESVDMMYNDPNTKAWTSHRWAPEGYHSRHDLIAQTKAAEMQKPLEGGHMHGAKEERFENAAGGANGMDAEKGHGMQPPRAPGMKEDAQRPYSEDRTVVNEA